MEYSEWNNNTNDWEEVSGRITFNYSEISSIQNNEKGDKYASIFFDPLFHCININITDIDDATFMLYDIKGSELIKQEINSNTIIQADYLNPGFYIFILKNRNEFQSGKLIKK